jgi:hypothetical protein
MNASNKKPQVSVEFIDKKIYEKSVVNQSSGKGKTSVGFTFEVATDDNIPAWVVDVVDLVPLCELSEDGRLRFDQFFDDLEAQIKKQLLDSSRYITWKVLQAAMDAQIQRENEAA